jgi:hypothetical protein
MSGPAHNPKALAEFQNGETRLVYARYRARPDAGPFYLEDGKAAKLKGWAKEHLECFMPECGDRRLTTVFRTGKRDGFTHYRGAGGHSLEGLFHQQAKALIERWMAVRYPRLAVQTEQRTRSGERRADVMVTWPDGRQLAIEVQYEPLTPEAWRIRQTSYEQQGIPVVWLLGHLEPLLRPAGLPGQIGLGVLHQAIAEAGSPLLWINPTEGKVGSAWVRSIPDAETNRVFCVRPGEADLRGFLEPTPSRTAT